MSFTTRFNNTITGAIAGAIVPVTAFLVFYLALADGSSLVQFIDRCIDAGNLLQFVSVSVFVNIVIFLVFNHFDMLRASKGVLGITIVWALAVFSIKLF